MTVLCFETCILLPLLIYTTYGCRPSCGTYLSNAHFQGGTVRITKSGIYCLTQDIIFNPHPSPISNPNADFGWFPFDDSKYKGSEQLTGGPYSLGWFAAISIETDNVEINLCQYQISQSLQFNFQQRWFNIIEIAKAPFESGSGPTDFGGLQSVKNIYIHNGKLGLSSHNAIHSNSANNVRLQDLKIFDFEVAGIQFNGAKKVIIRNVEIGPSNDDIKPSAYYSNARYVALAMRLLLQQTTYNPHRKHIVYSHGRRLSLQTVYNNLLTSMDIAFRYFLNANTENDIAHDLYDVSVDLYHNKYGLPDGSALYGIVLHSFSLAIFGFGQERNEAGDGEKIWIGNVQIHNLKLHTNEFASIYFDQCNDKRSQTQTFIKGPFGDTMDVRKMVDKEYRNVIDDGGDITLLEYVGNPLDDARIALALLGGAYELQFGSVSPDNKYFFGWALDEYEGVSYDGLPACAAFVCNGDVMFHNNKGIIGVRADLIDDFEINGIEIRKLINKTPLNSFACGAYDGGHDGGHPTQMDGYGGLSTCVTGMSVYGGDLSVFGENRIANLKSNNGDVVGVHVFSDAVILFDEDIKFEINNMKTCKSLGQNDINKLVKKGKYPYPNHCFVCNMLVDPVDNNDIYIDPYPPNGVDKVYCYDMNGERITLPIARTKYEARNAKLVYYDVHDQEYRNIGI